MLILFLNSCLLFIIIFLKEYVVAHETGHALGYWHTHQRPDREKFISINWRNVMEEATASFMHYRNMLQAFGIRQVSNRRSPYDYGSLMHYHAVAHAVKVSDFTIVPKELKYVTTMGTEKMAFLDAKVINDIYCPSKITFKYLFIIVLCRYVCSRASSSLFFWRVP